MGSASLIGLSVADWFQLRAAPARAKSVIQLWMAGGPTQTDTFDPKPQAGEDYSGPLRRAVQTNVAGVSIGELLPLLAKQADKYTIIRSTTHNNNAHETAAYIMQTGTMPSTELVYPATGAIVALKKTESGYAGSLPPYITLTNPLGRFSEAGFLGNNYKTFAPGGDPNSPSFRVQGLVPPRGMTEQRMAERRSLLGAVDALASQADKLDAYRSKTWRSAGCSPAPLSPGTPNSGGRRAWPPRRPGSAAGSIGDRPSRRWWRAAASRAARWWARPTPAARTCAIGRSIPGTWRPAFTNCWASIPRASCRIRKAAWPTSARSPAARCRAAAC